MSKKTKITLGIIAGLVLILILQSTVKFSSVPGLKPWKETADEIILRNKTIPEIKIVLKDGKWVIGDKEFTADEKEVTAILEKMKSLKLSEKVTSKKFYERFSLDSAGSIQVTVKSKGKILRDILIGKKSTDEQSFVKFSDKPDVYLAGGSLSVELDKNADSLRDKVLISCSRDDVESVSVKGRFAIEKKKDKAADPKKTAAPEVPQGGEQWVIKDKGSDADINRVNEFIDDLLTTQASSFADETTAKAAAASGAKVEIEIKGNGKTTVLTVYGKDTSSKTEKTPKYVCKSTENPYYALIDAGKAEKLIKLTADAITKK